LLYAFSQLTARTGVSFFLLIYYIAAVRPDVVSTSLALEVLLVAMVPTAVAGFVLPLRVIPREGATPINVSVSGARMAYRHNAPVAPQTTVRFAMTIAFPEWTRWQGF